MQQEEEQQPAHEEKRGEKQVEVKFVTRLAAEWKVTETPFRLPTKLTRHGLSEVVNHLLGRGAAATAEEGGEVEMKDEEPVTTKPIVPFDFLIGGDFIRTSIGKHLRDRSIVIGEGVITVEYTFADPPPGNLPPREHGDWVSSLGTISDTFISAGFDGKLRFWSNSGLISEFSSAHIGAIKTISSCPSVHSEFLTGGKDFLVKMWKLNDNKVEQIHSFIGHSNSVESIDISPDGSRACSASWDRTLRIWDISKQRITTIKEIPSKKRRKEEEEEEEEEENKDESIAVLKGHNDAVTAIQWPTHMQLISGGHDNTIRLWDVIKSTNVSTMHGQKSVSCLSYSTESGLCISGHHDGVIRIWDPRSSPNEHGESTSTITTKTIKAHRGWICSVKWHPIKQQTMFMTASHDGTLKIWDIRSSTVPMHASRGAHGSGNKIFCATWWQKSDNALEVLSGGSDGTVQRRSMP